MTSLIPERVLSKIIPIVSVEPSIDKVILFGSRARGDNKPNSDIDLALEGTNIPLRISTKLRDAAGLYKLDIVRLGELDDGELLFEIQQDGKVIYERNFKL
jgi:predicted nucleotidyltransferase